MMSLNQRIHADNKPSQTPGGGQEKLEEDKDEETTSNIEYVFKASRKPF